MGNYRSDDDSWFTKNPEVFGTGYLSVVDTDNPAVPLGVVNSKRGMPDIGHNIIFRDDLTANSKNPSIYQVISINWVMDRMSMDDRMTEMAEIEANSIEPKTLSSVVQLFVKKVY